MVALGQFVSHAVYINSLKKISLSLRYSVSPSIFQYGGPKCSAARLHCKERTEDGFSRVQGGVGTIILP